MPETVVRELTRHLGAFSVSRHHPQVHIDALDHLSTDVLDVLRADLAIKLGSGSGSRARSVSTAARHLLRNKQVEWVDIWIWKRLDEGSAAYQVETLVNGEWYTLLKLDESGRRLPLS